MNNVLSAKNSGFLIRGLVYCNWTVFTCAAFNRLCACVCVCVRACVRACSGANDMRLLTVD